MLVKKKYGGLLKNINTFSSYGILLCLTWVSYFFYIRDFGLYEDDYYEEHYDEEELKDDSEDDESNDDEKDEGEKKINMSFACEDCDYRWDDVIIKIKGNLEDENDEVEVACPMCGSMNVEQI